MATEHQAPFVNLLSVEEASAWQRRLYRTVRETMRAMAGRISGVSSWEAKKMLARHIWLDAEDANSVRERTLELRFPRVDVDLDVDAALIAVLAQLPSTTTDAEFLAGVYRVIKPAVLDAVRQYASVSDPIDDAPSARVFRTVILDMEEEMTAFAAVWESLPADERAASAGWENWLRAALDNAGGILGKDTGAPLLVRAGFSDRAKYTIPVVPKREPHWQKSGTQVPPRPPRNPEEQQIWIAIDHVNELWACELPAALIWHHEGLKWEMYRDTARWAYDEMRHSMMGERRLKAWGFVVGVDVPMVPDHWLGISPRSGMEGMLFAVHGLEQGGPKWKAELKERLYGMGDAHSSQDCDYDWADEAGHIRYGQDWIRTLYPDTPKSEIIRRTQTEVDLWKEWIAARHATGTHGYDVFLPRIEAKCAAMPQLGHRDLFKPMGSSAASKSYASNAGGA
jgi:hypothetical protein